MSPGQNIAELLISLSEDDLCTFIPKSTLDIIDSLYPAASRPECLRKLIIKTPVNELYDTGHLTFFIQFLSEKKLKELASRLNTVEATSVSQLIEVAQQPNSKVALLEFFGFDPSLYKKPLDPLSPIHCEPKYGLLTLSPESMPLKS